MRAPLTSVRGRVRAWVEQHADKLGNDVLEVGSRQHVPGAWWLVNSDLARGQWTGIDMQEGPGVDLVADAENLPWNWNRRFTGVLCSEVLEHVRHPLHALSELGRVLQPGGWIVVTTLFAFPEHGFPDDYRRWTRNGLQLELEEAGFVDVATAYSGEVEIRLNDHGEPGHCRRLLPMHVFAIGRNPP